MPARGSLFGSSTLSSAWALHFVDGAPLTLCAVVAGQGWIVPEHRRPERLRAGRCPDVNDVLPRQRRRTYRRGVVTSPLGPAAVELYGDLRLSPLLGRLLAHSSRLLHGVAGSISLIDPGRQRYAKMAEHGASCRLGQTFPLDEGATGEVVRRRRPVVLASYRQIGAGHLPAADPASSGAVAAVPIWWRGDVIGANVAFAGRTRSFTAGEVDDLEALTQLAAAGIVTAGRGQVSMRHLTGSPHDPPFTPREREVLALLASGASDRDIAAALVISTKTVEKHVGAVLRKSGATSRTAAVVRALAAGWLRTGAEAGWAVS